MDEKQIVRILLFYQAVTKMTSTTVMNSYILARVAEIYQVTICQFMNNKIACNLIKIFLQYTFYKHFIGNKRTAGQSSNQTLTRMNKALAINCNAKLNATDGATAKDWRGGIPVRVVRNFKLRKYSKYAPEEGNRYVLVYTGMHTFCILNNKCIVCIYV